jgi:TPR repeat protein
MSRSRRSDLMPTLTLALVLLGLPRSPLCDDGSRSPDARGECVTRLDAAKSAERCEAGDWRACVEAGDAYSDCGTPAATVKAVKLFGHACENGSAIGCRMLGGLYASNPAVHDPEAARSAYARAANVFWRNCEAGDGQACSDLADMVEAEQTAAPAGSTAAQLIARAVSLHDAACTSGRSLECRHLAELYATRKDDARSKATYLRACETGDPNSCCVVGISLRCGEASDCRVHKEAREYLERACVTGDLDCCSWAGAEYESGTAEDRGRAAALYERACTAGKPFSCYRLALIYESGVGRPHDPVKAAELFHTACTGGVREACAR